MISRVSFNRLANAVDVFALNRLQSAGKIEFGAANLSNRIDCVSFISTARQTPPSPIRFGQRSDFFLILFDLCQEQFTTHGMKDPFDLTPYSGGI